MTIYLDSNMIVAAKITEAPRNRNVQGYGNAIPTQYMVKLDRGLRSQWQRVYAICYSNSASHYVKAGAAGRRFLDVYSFERIEQLIAAPAYTDVSTITEYGLTQKLSNAIRVF